MNKDAKVSSNKLRSFLDDEGQLMPCTNITFGFTMEFRMSRRMHYCVAVDPKLLPNATFGDLQPMKSINIVASRSSSKGQLIWTESANA